MGIPLLGLSTGPNTSPLAIPDELAARGAAIGMEVTTARRAVLKTRLLPASEFDKIPAAQWDALSGKALVENPFYARKYTLGGLSTIDDGKRMSAFTVWSCEQNLIGFFPLRNYFGRGC